MLVAFSITYNECELCLLIPPAVVPFPNGYLKDVVYKFVISCVPNPVLVIAIVMYLIMRLVVQYNAKHKEI